MQIPFKQSRKKKIFAPVTPFVWQSTNKKSLSINDLHPVEKCGKDLLLGGETDKSSKALQLRIS